MYMLGIGSRRLGYGLNQIFWPLYLCFIIAIILHCSCSPNKINGFYLLPNSAPKHGLWFLIHQTNEVNSCNLQSLALVVTCRISNLHRMLEQHDSSVLLAEGYERRMVDAVYYLVQALKRMISWLSRLVGYSIDRVKPTLSIYLVCTSILCRER